VTVRRLASLSPTTIAGVALTGALLTGTTAAQTLVTEVIPVGHQEVEALAQTLRPLVPAPGSVSSFRDKLVVRTSAANLAELKEVIAALDHPPRSLLVSVHRGASGSRRAAGYEGSAAAGSAGAVSGSVRVTGTEGSSGEQVDQRLRVLEGRSAFIRTGAEVPVGERTVIVSGNVATVQDSVRYRDATTGIYVRPRLRGQHVTLEIIPHRARPSGRGDGTFEVEEAHTVVSGRLGEWIEIGGVDRRAEDARSGILHSGGSVEEAGTSIFVRVDEVGG